MVKKKSNLCVALDVTQAKDLLTLTRQLGPHIAVLKTHSDAVRDFSEEVQKELTALAKQHEFLILEDRCVNETVKQVFFSFFFKV